jgi:hypothetical protein
MRSGQKSANHGGLQHFQIRRANPRCEAQDRMCAVLTLWLAILSELIAPMRSPRTCFSLALAAPPLPQVRQGCIATGLEKEEGHGLSYKR